MTFGRLLFGSLFCSMLQYWFSNISNHPQIHTKKTSEKSFCHYNWTEKQVAPHNSLASRDLRAGTKTGLCIFSRLFQDHNRCIMKLESKCSCPHYQACKPQVSNPSIMFANVWEVRFSVTKKYTTNNQLLSP